MAVRAGVESARRGVTMGVMAAVPGASTTDSAPGGAAGNSRTARARSSAGRRLALSSPYERILLKLRGST